ncbi:MAG: HEAT repeat domain-containing protein [Actinomycetia bacterium]|nr:HEAT repeat domain-containing protein [Actinomycetes bacterium]
MAARRSFKSDESFLTKIAIGATGTRKVFEDLQNQGHNPIELERGSMTFKIWKTIKIKRIRVPDILCVKCGSQVESRAKTNLEISMSHSISDPERGWDFGLCDKDFVAYVVCSKTGDAPVDWQAQDLIQYVAICDMREAQVNSRAVLLSPKGAEEGFEARYLWPATIANYDGVVDSISADCLKYRRSIDNRSIRLSLAKKGLQLNPIADIGDEVVSNQVLAATVPVKQRFNCDATMTEENYIDMLGSPSLSERYAAAKALSSFPADGVSRALIAKVDDEQEHLYVRLEAAASLARLGIPEGWHFIEDCLSNEYLQNKLEAVIILAEISEDESVRLLLDVLSDGEERPEIRAGAAWALGELAPESSLAALVDSFSEVDEEIRIEAARALAKLTSRYAPDVFGLFTSTNPEKRPGVAWAISNSGEVDVEELLHSIGDEDTRQWAAYIIGNQDQGKFIAEIESLKTLDPELYFAVTVLWKIMASWVFGLEEYG